MFLVLSVSLELPFPDQMMPVVGYHFIISGFIKVKNPLKSGLLQNKNNGSGASFGSVCFVIAHQNGITSGTRNFELHLPCHLFHVFK
jgi:hypothetical protein